MDTTLGIVTRIDQAHGPSGADFSLPESPRPPSPDQIALAAGVVSERVRAQVETQAEQLAEHLRSRQRELDQREAQLSARCEELENEMRTFRLWASQRDEALGEQAQALQQQSARLATRAADVVAVEEALWGKLSQTAPSAELFESMDALRQELSEHYRAVREANEQQAQQLRQLAAKLEAQRSTLLTQRRTVEDWLHRRQAEVEQQHQHWTARERTVAPPVWLSWELQQQWTKQRQEFLRQLRDSPGPQPNDRSCPD